MSRLNQWLGSERVSLHGRAFGGARVCVWEDAQDLKNGPLKQLQDFVTEAQEPLTEKVSALRASLAIAPSSREVSLLWSRALWISAMFASTRKT